MSDFFEFEADFVDSLRCIPMQVRMKLDTCGVKLKLSHWHDLTDEERQSLVDLSCTTEKESQAYREFLHKLILERTGTPASDLPVEDSPAWMDAKSVPPIINEKAQELGLTVTPSQWASLTPLQRFALIKLSRASHENKNFLPALEEFKLFPTHQEM